jgi:hypothetical protein
MLLERLALSLMLQQRNNSEFRNNLIAVGGSAEGRGSVVAICRTCLGFFIKSLKSNDYMTALFYKAFKINSL